MTDVVVELIVARDRADLAADGLWLAGATAVAESEVAESEGAESEVGQRGSDVVKLVASFPTPDAAKVVAAEVGGTVVIIEPSEWQHRWKDFAQPVAVGRSLVIAPAWRAITLPGAGTLGTPGVGGPHALVVRIDPGPCFGSGTHPSTRLLLAQLADLAERGRLAGQRVLDVGCGSGILSVTAALLGAMVTAIDIDPDAVAYTQSNAAANGVAHRVSASTRPPEGLGGGFGLALVNVTAAVHAVVGPPTAVAVRPGGTLLLAGLLPGQWRHVAGAYPGTVMTDRPSLDGWEGVVLARG